MTTSARSYNMSRIHSKDTKPELIVRKYLWNLGYRYRKNDKRLPGTPDIVLKKYATVIFIHGCFWHGHEHITWPKTNAEFWRKKIERNRQRDEEDKQKLKSMGWSVMTIWECQLTKKKREHTLREIEYLLNHNFLDRLGKVKHPVKHYELVPEYYDIAADPEAEYNKRK
jgi:DNA mismatch endonuclease (patch repair protein)